MGCTRRATNARGLRTFGRGICLNPLPPPPRGLLAVQAYKPRWNGHKSRFFERAEGVLCTLRKMQEMPMEWALARSHAQKPPSGQGGRKSPVMGRGKEVNDES